MKTHIVVVRCCSFFLFFHRSLKLRWALCFLLGFICWVLFVGFCVFVLFCWVCLGLGPINSYVFKKYVGNDSALWTKKKKN
jgi:hypothetical protein